MGISNSLTCSLIKGLLFPKNKDSLFQVGRKREIFLHGAIFYTDLGTPQEEEEIV